MNQILGLGIIVIGIFYVLSLMRSNNEANSNEDFHAAQHTICKNRYVPWGKVKHIEWSNKLNYNQAIAKCKKDSRCKGVQIRGYGGKMIKGGRYATEATMKQKYKNVFTGIKVTPSKWYKRSWYAISRYYDKGPNRKRGLAAARRAGYKINKWGSWYWHDGGRAKDAKRTRVVYGFRPASPQHTTKSGYVRFFGKDAPRSCGTHVAGKSKVKGVNDKLKAQYPDHKYKNTPTDYVYFK